MTSPFTQQREYGRNDRLFSGLPWVWGFP